MDNNKSDHYQPCTQLILKTIPVNIEIPMTTNDIFNWLTDCQDAAVLRYLGRYALRCA